MFCPDYKLINCRIIKQQLKSDKTRLFVDDVIVFIKLLLRAETL